MGNSLTTRVDKDFFESYIVKQQEQEKDRGNKKCSTATATSILKKRLDNAGGLAEEY